MALRKQEPEAYELLDQRDEEQILAEIKGNIITEMFYSFKLEGREVTGVSWVGTKEIARQYGGINMDFVRVDETPLAYIAICKATDTKRGTSLLGTAMQSKMMNTRAGEVEDRFAYTKAVSKAQRNAIRAIIPERFLIEMYEQFRKGGKPEKPEPRKQVPTEVKPVEKPAEKPKLQSQAKIQPGTQEAEEQVKATLEVNDVDTTFLTIVKYGDAVRIMVQEGYNEIGWVDDHAVINKLLGGTWNAESGWWTVKQ